MNKTRQRLDVIEAAINDKRLVVKDKIDERYFVNQEATEAANHRVALVKENGRIGWVRTKSGATG
jgi:hypothetical protein